VGLRAKRRRIAALRPFIIRKVYIDKEHTQWRVFA
jgi:hypothetical protein